mmetsp:Transcript_19664/g.48055  ORF Transcript_19664/g.48055 Transcript_19664/m.48055 type:complete len:200 (-) Transcript_19664:1578-2177(-)
MPSLPRMQELPLPVRPLEAAAAALPPSKSSTTIAPRRYRRRDEGQQLVPQPDSASARPRLRAPRRPLRPPLRGGERLADKPGDDVRVVAVIVLVVVVLLVVVLLAVVLVPGPPRPRPLLVRLARGAVDVLQCAREGLADVPLYYAVEKARLPLAPGFCVFAGLLEIPHADHGDEHQAALPRRGIGEVDVAPGVDLVVGR